MTSQFSDTTSSSTFLTLFVSLVRFSYWSKFHVNIITGSGVMTIFFIRNWPEIRKAEIPTSEFCPISGDWGQWGIPNIARTSLIKCYWMLQNGSVTAFTVSELLRKTNSGGKITPSPPRLGLRPEVRKKMFLQSFTLELYDLF